MCTMNEGHYAITIGHCSIQLGVLQVPQLLQGRCLVGGAGGKAPRSSDNIVFYSTGKGLKTRLKTLSYHGEILKTNPVNVCNTSFDFKTCKVLQTTHCRLNLIRNLCDIVIKTKNYICRIFLKSENRWYQVYFFSVGLWYK